MNQFHWLSTHESLPGNYIREQTQLHLGGIEMREHLASLNK